MVDLPDEMPAASQPPTLTELESARIEASDDYRRTLGWLMVADETPDTETLLAQLLNRPEWHQRAACRGADPDLFFPDPSSGRPVRALAYCDGCQVRPECLAIALDAGSHSDVGVWGGTSVRQRRVLRRGSVA